MARTLVGYIPSGYLNSAAQSGPTGSVEPATLLPIATGLTLGAIAEYTDTEALTYSNPRFGQVQAIAQVTAGSGMTPGTYPLTFSASPTGNTATGTITVTATTISSYTITNPGYYTAPPTVTFTPGGTATILATTIYNQLFSGTYTWVQLDPAVAGLVPVGTPLYWLQTSTGYVVTTVSTADVNSPDFAGWSIDPNFGAANPYAFIQQNGKGFLLFPAAGFPAAYGVVVNQNVGNPNFTSLAAGTLTVTQPTVGFALAVGSALTASLCRVTVPVSRF